MIHHIIVKWNTDTDKAALADEVRELYKTASEIPGVYGVEIRENVIPRDNRYDLMIALNMEKDALTVWDNSELHKKWKFEYSELIEKKCIFDSDN